jgi:hypothetical protein
MPSEYWPGASARRRNGMPQATRCTRSLASRRRSPSTPRTSYDGQTRRRIADNDRQSTARNHLGRVEEGDRPLASLQPEFLSAGPTDKAGWLPSPARCKALQGEGRAVQTRAAPPARLTRIPRVGTSNRRLRHRKRGYTLTFSLWKSGRPSRWGRRLNAPSC